MKLLDVFYQREESQEIEHLEIAPEANFSKIRALLIEKHGLHSDVLLFLEDEDNPVSDKDTVGQRSGNKDFNLHLHRCRHIDVSVTYNGKTVSTPFGPGATVARVKHWAAIGKFEISPDDAGEMVLQIAGTHDRPTPSTHIGTLTKCPVCKLAFDLLPDERVNGSNWRMS